MQYEVRPLNKREMQVALWMLHEGMNEMEIMAAQLRAIEVIEGMDATGMPVDSQLL